MYFIVDANLQTLNIEISLNVMMYRVLEKCLKSVQNYALLAITILGSCTNHRNTQIKCDQTRSTRLPTIFFAKPLSGAFRPVTISLEAPW